MFYDSAVCCFLGNAGSSEAISGKVTLYIIELIVEKKDRGYKKTLLCCLS
jgi:hypothetical protein